MSHKGVDLTRRSGSPGEQQHRVRRSSSPQEQLLDALPGFESLMTDADTHVNPRPGLEAEPNAKAGKSDSFSAHLPDAFPDLPLASRSEAPKGKCPIDHTKLSNEAPSPKASGQSKCPVDHSTFTTTNGPVEAEGATTCPFQALAMAVESSKSSGGAKPVVAPFNFAAMMGGLGDFKHDGPPKSMLDKISSAEFTDDGEVPLATPPPKFLANSLPSHNDDTFNQNEKMSCPFSSSPGLSEMDIARTQSFKSKTSTFQKRQVGDGASAMPSRRSGSRNSSSRKPRKGGRPRQNRNKRLTGYSQWEAQTYIPVIRSSWAKVKAKLELRKIGNAMYDTLFDKAPQLKGMFTTPQEIMGLKFADMLDGLVVKVEDPISLYEQLKGLAPMHQEKGVAQDHLPVMADSIFALLGGVLGPDFNLEVRTAWEWLWTWVSQTLLQTMDEVANEQTAISQSWDIALDNYDEMQLGELFYDTLFEMAPNLKHVFSKPKQMLSVKFCDMMSTIVSFQGDYDRLREQSMWLGIRHIKYGAKLQHLGALQEVLVNTMAAAVGDEWTEEMERAWSEIFIASSKIMMETMAQAEEHGPIVQELWKKVQGRTSLIEFGSALRKALLSGTEWVQSLALDPSQKEPLLEHSETKKTFVGGATFSDKSPQSDNIGNHFWHMITDSLELMWQPERQNEKLIVMTDHFYRSGVRISHLQTIGGAIERTMERVLGSEWSEKEAKAWNWWWKMTSHTMEQCLSAYEQEHVDIIQSSWQKVRESKPLEELGEKFFQELANLAPHIIHIFRRPKKIQAMQFVHAIDMLVSFSEKPEEFFTDLKPLTLRHIKYGVKPDYAKPFGRAILRGLEKELGEEWDEKVTLLCEDEETSPRQ